MCPINARRSMTERTRYVVLLVALAIVWRFEFSPDLHPGWTFDEAMNYGGLAFVAVYLLLFLFRRE